MTENIENKPEKFYLWWLSSDSNKRHPAGVAFYEEKYGEYRLKIDLFSAMEEKPTQLYLRSIGNVDDRILFRAEVAMKKNGKYIGRYPVGDGFSSEETDGEIYIDLGPYERRLVLSQNT